MASYGAKTTMAVGEGKNSQTELLRAVAITYTLFHHLAIATGHLPQLHLYVAKFGMFHIGVDLFFVISGFVITLSLSRSVTEFQISRWRSG